MIKILDASSLSAAEVLVDSRDCDSNWNNCLSIKNE